MVDARLFYPGCKIRIVDKWVKPSVPPMEPWRGKIMTVKQLLTPYDSPTGESDACLNDWPGDVLDIVMEETGDGLVWFLEDIEEIIEEFDFVFSQESLIDFML